MRNLIRSMVIGVALALVVAGSAPAKPETVRVGNLVLVDDGWLSPTKLPKHKQGPVNAYLSASISTVDGSHLPAAREVVVDLDKHVHVNAEGLPVCRAGRLTSRNTGDARRACGKAIVGKGDARVEVAFPEQAPIMASSPLTIFNGGVKGGKTTLFIHGFITVPVPAAVVATVEITPIREGHFGSRIVAKIPKISGGAGSLTKTKLKIDQKKGF
jgi:hypothetical protein